MSLDRFGLLQFGSDKSCSPCWIGQLHQPKARAKAPGPFWWVSIDEIIPVFQDPASIAIMEL